MRKPERSRLRFFTFLRTKPARLGPGEHTTKVQSVPNPGKRRVRKCEISASVDGSGSQGVPVLYGLPVSNFTARCRYIIREKGLDIAEKKPEDGLKSDGYMEKSPFGLVPCLSLPSGQNIIESQVIAEYLVDKYADVGPTFLPKTPEERAKMRLISQLHDMHLGTNQKAMYRQMPSPEARAAGIEALKNSFRVLESYCEAGPYMVGSDVSLADAAIIGSSAFYNFMLPRFFGWDFRDGNPNLAKWHDYLLKESDAAKEVYDSVWAELAKWEQNGRWEKLGIPRWPSFTEA